MKYLPLDTVAGLLGKLTSTLPETYDLRELAIRTAIEVGRRFGDNLSNE